MATKVHMEALSPTMEEGQLVRWLKQEGDPVAEGDVLAEIETDKATMELVARGSGVMRKHLLQEGQSAPVGEVIGVVAEADEDISAIAAEAPAAAAAPTPTRKEREEADMGEAAAAVAATGQTETYRAEAEAEAAAPAGDGRTKASPLARRLAAETGVDLAQVRGTGPGGRIVKRDIEEAQRAPAAPAPAPMPAVAAAPAGPEVEEIPVTQMRKTIARRLVTSIGPVPTFYLTVEVDMGRMGEMRERLNARLEKSGVKVSVNDLVIKATAMALARHPEVNAQWADSVIRRFRRVHIGVAVAVEDGLITPVVRDAHLKGVAQIAQEVRELAGRGREKKLAPEEYSGSTFSISNLGMFGIDEFTAIINPPEAAILAVGKAEEKAVVENGEIVVRQRMRMTMSCDHRVIDGATGAKFLQTLRDYLEDPMMMLA